MAFTRESYIRGPAKITFDGVTLMSRGDIRLVINEATFPVSNDVYGKLDERISDRLCEVTFVPDGSFDDDIAGALWPLSATATYIGTSLFGAQANVKPLVIADTGGRSFTLTDARVTKMPDVILSAVKTAIGPVTFTGIGKISWADAASLYTEGALVWAAPTAGTIPTVPYAVSWGNSAPWDAVETAEGVTVSFNQNIQPVTVDSYGTVDFTYTALEVSAKFRPVNVSATALAAKLTGVAQGTGAARGKSVAGSDNLVIDGGASNPKMTINKAAVKNPAFAWGMVTGRIGELELVATLTATSDSLFTFIKNPAS